MSGRHVVGADELHTDQPAEAPPPEEAQLHPEPSAAELIAGTPTEGLDPDIAVEPPEQYVEPVEEHEHTGTGPVQWVEGDAP